MNPERAGKQVALIALLILLMVPAATRGAEGPRPLWLAVTRPMFAEALAPLAAHRRAEGLEAVVSTRPIAEAIAAAGRRPACLLLVGDDEPGQQAKPWYVPAKRKGLYRWRANQGRQFASDIAWADLDGDDRPEFPVGRIPARTVKQVAVVVAKILAYERRAPTVSDLRLPAWVGSPFYGEPIDSMATSLLLTQVRTQAPAWVQPWAISADANHALCGWPADQPKLFLRQLQRGGAISVIMGHADRDSFDAMHHDGQRIELTVAKVATALATGTVGPPTVLFTCLAGDFTTASPCLAEAMLFAPGGPVATVAATTESHPLPNFYAGVAMLRTLGQPTRRLGTFSLRSQRAAADMRNFLVETALANAEGSLEARINTASLRRDSRLMYVLLGDPATRMRLPKPLEVHVESAGENTWRWKAVKPEGAGRLHVGLRAAKWTFPPAAKPLTPAAARPRFEAANAAFAFGPLPAPPDGKPWEGTVTSPGILRLVTVADDGLYAAAVALEPEPEAANTRGKPRR